MTDELEEVLTDTINNSNSVLVTESSKKRLSAYASAVLTHLKSNAREEASQKENAYKSAKPKVNGKSP